MVAEATVSREAGLGGVRGLADIWVLRSGLGPASGLRDTIQESHGLCSLGRLVSVGV